MEYHIISCRLINFWTQWIALKKSIVKFILFWVMLLWCCLVILLSLVFLWYRYVGTLLILGSNSGLMEKLMSLTGRVLILWSFRYVFQFQAHCKHHFLFYYIIDFWKYSSTFLEFLEPFLIYIFVPVQYLCIRTCSNLFDLSIKL